ncbi:NAD(P)H-hydrate dehydratase [Candidatus Gottesmanbacteria bacterium]|nr:NAD(P)H-hydrate dehydratase [Candidatus Gottesmanbacteria bacterium]
MKSVTVDDLKKLYLPPPTSHKGQNGRLCIIGGSHLFHAASLWALTVASRIVDLVHYSSVPENNTLVEKIKSEFRDGIVVPRSDLDAYIEEDDVILIGPGMTRSSLRSSGQARIGSLRELEQIHDEGLLTAALTNYLLAKYPQKQWVIDAGALQMMDVSLIPKNAILTPHHGELEGLTSRMKNYDLRITNKTIEKQVEEFAREYQCIILLKGPIDIMCSSAECREVVGGNSGMTKGGTGDVLAGLVAALACKNDPFLAAIAGSFINKKAGDALYSRVGPFFNASDLANQIPRTMKELLIP